MRSWLIEARIKKGLTQKEVAEKVKISQPSICDIEQGNKNPRPATAKRIAQVLGFDWTRFFDK
jgi:transcriptional regulator with XRE-family HTH domain